MKEMTLHSPHYNLVESENALQAFVASRRFQHLIDADKDFLFSLQNSITTLNAQRGWNRKGGLIAKFHAQLGNANTLAKERNEKLLPPALIQQQELLKEDIETDINSRKLTRLVVTTMQNRIIHRLQYPALPHMKELLEKLKECNEAILSVMDNEQTACEKKSDHPFARSLALNANAIGGRYISSAQMYDPLAGAEGQKENGVYQSSAGHCFGHVMAWRDEVVEKGYCELLSRQHAISHAYQYSQRDIKLGFWQGRRKGRIVRTCIIHPAKEIRSAIEKMIAVVSPENIYEIAFNWRLTHSAHATGLRKLPSGEYEFFDANHGLFVFETREQLVDWLVILLDAYHLTYQQDGHLALIHIGYQPCKARPSIPRVLHTEIPAEYVNELFMHANEEARTRYHAAKTFQDKEHHLLNLHQTYINEICIMSKRLSDRQTDLALENSLISQQMELNRIIKSAPSNRDTIDEQVQNIRAERDSLTQAVIHLLENEKKRVRFKYLSRKQSSIIASLNDLIMRVANNKTSSLASLIDRWRESAPRGARTNNRELLTGTKTAKVILHLYKHHEVSPYRLNLLHSILLERLIETIFNRDWSSTVRGYGGVLDHHQHKIPHTILALRNKIETCLAQGLSTKEILAAIKMIAKQNHGNVFYCLFRWRSRKLNHFYRCLSQIDVNNPYQLARVRVKVKKLDEEKLRLCRVTDSLTTDTQSISPSHQNMI